MPLYYSYLTLKLKADFSNNLANKQSSAKLPSLVEQFYAFLFTNNSLENSENEPLCTSTLTCKHIAKIQSVLL